MGEISWNRCPGIFPVVEEYLHRWSSYVLPTNEMILVTAIQNLFNCTFLMAWRPAVRQYTKYPDISDTEQSDLAFLYARLQTGGIMVGWYPSVRPSIHLSIHPSIHPSIGRSVRPGHRPGFRPSVTVFRTFLLHALTYWDDILHVTFFLWTFDQVRVSSTSVRFCNFWNLKYWKFTVFPQTSLTCFHMTFAYDFVLLCYRSS